MVLHCSMTDMMARASTAIMNICEKRVCVSVKKWPNRMAVSISSTGCSTVICCGCRAIAMIMVHPWMNTALSVERVRVLSSRRLMLKSIEPEKNINTVSMAMDAVLMSMPEQLPMEVNVVI